MLEHSALIYETREQFVEQMLPFVRAGVEAEEPVFVVTSAANIDALRESLNGQAASVEFTDSGTWYTRPAATLDRYRAKMDEFAATASSVRVVGEPTWRGSKGAIREWARYESVINEALRDTPLLLVCPYDAGRLPDDIVEHARATHPTVTENTGTHSSSAYVPPRLFAASPPRPGSLPGASELVLDGPRSLRELRRSVGALALDAGVADERARDIVLAVSEVATNALRHGAPPVHVEITVDGDEFICNVADSGPGVQDSLAGWIPPSDTELGGWGLVLARRLSDALELASNGHGASVTLHFALA